VLCLIWIDRVSLIARSGQEKTVIAAKSEVSDADEEGVPPTGTPAQPTHGPITHSGFDLDGRR
jgi:hypothetical protein